MGTTFDIYVFISISAGERLVTEGIIRLVFSVLTLTWFIKYMFNVKVILH